MNTLIKEYIHQEGRLPDMIRNRIKENIYLYALADLDSEKKFSESWVIVTERCLIIATKENIKEVTLCSIEEVKEVHSLSTHSLIFIKNHDCYPLAEINFTSRQKIAMGHISYLVNQMIKGRSIDYLECNSDELYQESVMRPILEAQNSIAKKQSATLVRLLKYLLPYKKSLIWGALGAFLATIVSLAPAYISGLMIDKMIRPFQDGKLEASEAISLAWIALAALISCYVLREVFMWLRLRKMSILGEYVAMDLRKELYSHLQRLSMDFFSKKQTGSIISRVSSDTDRIWDFIAFGVVEVGIAIITLISLSAVLITLDWRLGLVMTLPVPIMLFCIYRHGEHMKNLFLRGWRKWTEVTNVLSDTIPGIQVVKAFNQEEREKKRFNERNDTVTVEFNNIHRSWTKFWPALMLSMHLTIITVWWLAIPRLFSESNSPTHLSAGVFVSFLLYVTMFSTPIEIIGQMARMLNRALSSAHRVFEILDTNPSIDSSKGKSIELNVKGDISFKRVCFSYDGVRKVVDQMSFDIKAGEMIGLVGASGGGKSTLTKLLTRFYDIDSGEILIDGMNLKDLKLGSFRKQVGMVLQDPYLFHGSIFDNISYGMDEVDRRKVVEAAKIANAHEFILRLPHGYDTVVGEKGHTLSGGERQRISIARAVLTDPKILILDEATSAVDTETERKIQDALDKLVEGRTVLAIAHRLSTLRKADRIFVVEKGSIKEKGTHSELLAKENGTYRKLQRMQKEMDEAFVV